MPVKTAAARTRATVPTRNKGIRDRRLVGRAEGFLRAGDFRGNGGSAAIIPGAAFPGPMVGTGVMGRAVAMACAGEGVGRLTGAGRVGNGAGFVAMGTGFW